MKNVDSIKEFCKYEHEEYIVRMSPYELFLMKTALINWKTDIEIEMEEYEWENNEQNKKRLEEVNKLYQDLREIPF